MSQTVIIPSCMNPFEITINNHTYSFKAGESVEMPDDVAEVIKHHVDSVPKPLDKEEGSEGSSSDVLTQEKTVDITENGPTEITADEGYLLSKVTANVNVASSGGGVNKFQQLVSKTITEVTAEDMEGATITFVFSSMFNDCVSLKKCYLPDTITNIGSYAFNNCSSLVSVNIPSTVTGIGNDAFNNCKALASITIPSLVTTIGSAICKSCSSLKTVVILGKVTRIDAQAFMYCNNLEKVTIYAETPPTITANAFYNLNAVCRIEVPAASVDAYKSATNWSKYADQIFAIEE